MPSAFFGRWRAKLRTIFSLTACISGDANIDKYTQILFGENSALPGSFGGGDRDGEACCKTRAKCKVSFDVQFE